jgi:hypothetical protein
MRLIALGLLASLVLAVTASASAADAIPPADAVAAEGAIQAPSAGTVVDEVVQAAPEPPPVPPVAQEVTPVGEGPEVVPVPPVVEEVTEAVPVPPVVEEVTEAVPAPPVAPPVAEEIPEAASGGPPEVAPEPAPEAAPVIPVTEETPRAGVEEASEASLSGGRSEEAPKGSTAPGPPASSASSGSEPLEPATVVSSTAPAVGDPGETWAMISSGTPSGPPPASGDARPAASPSCQLSVLNGPITNCTTGWLGTQGLLRPASATLSSPAVSWSIQGTLAPAGGGHDDSAVATRPATPTPGPAPGGASPSAAVGGSGLALSAFLTLTGLLLLAAPRAMRRLRLSCEPWLTAFFVLIPERPG